MKANTIIRVKRDTPFVQINKTALQDTRLSWKAKGLLAYMLSLPDDWQFYVSELKNHAKDGRDATASAMNELIDMGYLNREEVRDDKGKFQGYNYTLYEYPVTENPKTENPESGKPYSENPELLITNNTNKEITNNYNTDSVVLEKTPQDAPFYYEFETSLKYLSSLNGRTYKIPKSYTNVLRYGVYKKLVKIFKAGYTLEHVKGVIKYKADEWLDDAKMYRYVDTDTLFASVTKFEKYYGQYTMKRPESKTKTTDTLKREHPLFDKIMQLRMTLKNLRIYSDSIKDLSPEDQVSKMQTILKNYKESKEHG